MLDTYDITGSESGVIVAYDLGLAPYIPVQQLQMQLRRAVLEGRIAGALLLLEHQSVITLGAHASTTDVSNPPLAASRGVQIVRSERGGQTTLHAPGQLVSYPVFRIPHRDLRAYVRDLEEILLRVIATTGVEAYRVSGRPGLYAHEMKIASLGLRCEHGVASHGSALNVDVDLSLFDLITSCGEPGLRQTSIAQIAREQPSLEAAKATYIEMFRLVFGADIGQLRRTSLEEVFAQLAQLD